MGDERVQQLAAELVVRFDELGWLPHGATLTKVNGAWYRIDLKRMEQTMSDEVWEDFAECD